MSLQEKTPNYALLLGKGRSGTSWLASILNTYQHCCYKNEPFPKKLAPYNGWLALLKQDNNDIVRQNFEEICRHCYHGIDQQPYPGKSFLPQNPLLLRLLRGMGTKTSKLKFLYEWYGKLQLTEQHSVLIKDVTFTLPPRVFMLPRLLNVLQPHLITLVRSPYANIVSVLQGREKQVFSSYRSREQAISNLQKMMDTPLGQHLSAYKIGLEEMSIVQFEALRWRVEVEGLVKQAQSYSPSLLVVYEDLCMNPEGKTTEIFDFLGWELGQATRDFLIGSTSGEKDVKLSARERYYSVYRDPVQSLQKWKSQLTSKQIAEISEIVCESPLLDLWSDLQN